MRIRGFALTLALIGSAGACAAQALSGPGATPIAGLLGDGFTVAAASPNGRAGEVVLILRKDAKVYACVLSDVRAELYGEAKAKPTAQPCLPLD
ncbi:hypothetical protein EYW49_12340 [Siculibacillus lacustris]|uniref:Uncharacterized protein n=1 Tax=Siculibacillus lacustris TaxID=1549641 RepID=A0A4Q9VMV9_9HYPH|nr:hypothetical protein [Siculibacillus lacustris]TBW36939.1 hypothetical protein EYW49_12340 [Siculibacillus lacustris]